MMQTTKELDSDIGAVIFVKMQANGNDFVVIDGRHGLLKRLVEFAQSILDRRYGVGGDGLIIIDGSKRADFKMIYFNADGTRDVCGNAIRCAARFIFESGMVPEEMKEFEIETNNEDISVKIFNRAERIRIELKGPLFDGALIPTADEGEHIGIQLEIDGSEYTATAVGMGNPHCVVLVEDVASLDIADIGPKFEKHSLFPEHTNVEFVQLIDSQRVKVRIWERGVGETMSCGIGACAAVAALVCLNKTSRRVVVETPGGELEVKWNQKADNIQLMGEARFVFKGELALSNLCEHGMEVKVSTVLP